jgi:methionyl-tRNA synthetase
LLLVCQWCAVALSPVMPHAGRRLLDLLAIEHPVSWNDAASDRFLTQGHRCRVPEPLFPRIQAKAVADFIQLQTRNKEKSMNDGETSSTQTRSQNGATAGDTTPAVEEVCSVPTDAAAVPPVQVTEPATAASSPAPATEKETIEYADFAKVELRAAKILEAERVPKADKLLKLQVDLGSERRQILAGIAQEFEPEALIGKTIVVVANLAPRTMRGLQSQGMLLAASAEADGPPSGLLTVDADVPPGSIIR